jgi:hypothetical protein
VFFTINTSIKADVPTVNGNIYKLEMLEKLASDFNKRIKKMNEEGRQLRGGWLDRDNIGKSPEKTFFDVQGIMVEEGILKAVIKLDEDVEHTIKEAIDKDEKISAQPIIQVPMDQKLGGPIDKIDGIKAIMLTTEKEHKHNGNKFIQD